MNNSVVPAFDAANAINPHSAVTPIQYTGSPSFVQYLKIFGAIPSIANAYSVLDEAYKSEFPADQAATSKTALMMDGRALIPAESMAMTNGEAEASPPPTLLRRRVEFEGTRRPMMRIERT